METKLHIYRRVEREMIKKKKHCHVPIRKIILLYNAK